MPTTDIATDARNVALDAAIREPSPKLTREDLKALCRCVIKQHGMAEFALLELYPTVQKLFPGLRMSLDAARVLIDDEETIQEDLGRLDAMAEAKAFLDEVPIAEPWEKLAHDQDEFRRRLRVKLDSFAAVFERAWGVEPIQVGRPPRTTIRKDQVIYVKWLKLGRCSWGTLRLEFKSAKRTTLADACRRQESREIERLEGFLAVVFAGCRQTRAYFADTF